MAIVVWQGCYGGDGDDHEEQIPIQNASATLATRYVSTWPTQQLAVFFFTMCYSPSVAGFERI